MFDMARSDHGSRSSEESVISLVGGLQSLLKLARQRVLQVSAVQRRHLLRTILHNSSHCSSKPIMKVHLNPAVHKYPAKEFQQLYGVWSGRRFWPP